MNSGFLLKFQEIVKPITMDERTAKICTFVEQEKSNEGFVILLAATRTFTEVRPEAADPDRNSRFLNVFPR